MKVLIELGAKEDRDNLDKTIAERRLVRLIVFLLLIMTFLFTKQFSIISI